VVRIIVYGYQIVIKRADPIRDYLLGSEFQRQLGRKIRPSFSLLYVRYLVILLKLRINHYGVYIHTALQLLMV